jgi:hypothetical protein
MTEHLAWSTPGAARAPVRASSKGGSGGLAGEGENCIYRNITELVALEVGDLVEVQDGFRLTVRKSKTDQEGEGPEIAIPAATGCGLSRRCRRG